MIIKKNKQRHNKITEQEILVSDSQVSSDANIVATEFVDVTSPLRCL